MIGNLLVTEMVKPSKEVAACLHELNRTLPDSQNTGEVSLTKNPS